MGVWLLNITPVPIRQNQGFLIFLITQSGVKTIEYFHCTCRITGGNKNLQYQRSYYAGVINAQRSCSPISLLLDGNVVADKSSRTLLGLCVSFDLTSCLLCVPSP